MGIPKGAILHFVKDPSVCVKVFDNKQVEYESKPCSLSRLTAKLLKSAAEYIAPMPNWTYEGKNLHEVYEETYPAN